MSRDLHDAVGQLLTGLSLSAKAAQAAAGPTSSALSEVVRIADVVGREPRGLRDGRMSLRHLIRLTRAFRPRSRPRVQRPEGIAGERTSTAATKR